MRKFLIFTGGFVAGILATIFAAYIIGIANKPIDNGVLGLTIFPEKGDCILTKGKLEIFQVVEPNMALARTGDLREEILVLLINYDAKSTMTIKKIDIPAKSAQNKLELFNIIP